MNPKSNKLTNNPPFDASADPPVDPPVDHIFGARIKKASNLADILWDRGWSPLHKTSEVDWLNVVEVSGRKRKLPSEETKLLTLKLLNERWKEKKGR